MRKLKSRKIRKRKNNSNFIVKVVIIVLAFTFSVGYSVLTTNLNFNVTAKKNPGLLADEILSSYSSRFLLYDGVYYNQGDNIYIKFNNTNHQLLSIQSDTKIMKIIALSPQSPMAFNSSTLCANGATGNGCDNYYQRGTYSASSMYTTFSNYITNTLNATSKSQLTEGPSYWGKVSTANSNGYTGVIEKSKTRVTQTKVTSLSLEDYVMRAPAPSSGTTLIDYSAGMSKLGLYNYNMWFINSYNLPIVWKSGGSGFAEVSATTSSTYRPIYVYFLSGDLKLKSGSGTSSNPYLIY